MLSRTTNKGFTLIELMMVVVILGILTAIGIPAYKKYVINAKIAEAYQAVGVMRGKEYAFYAEHNEFLFATTTNPTEISDPMFLQDSANWKNLNPYVPGDRVLFSYYITAGKIDNSGTELINSPTTGNSFTGSTSLASTNTRRQITGGPRCNTNLSATSLGAVAQNNYNWMIISAVGDLDGDKSDVCTAVLQFADALTGEGPSSNGIVVLFRGN